MGNSFGGRAGAKAFAGVCNLVANIGFRGAAALLFSPVQCLFPCAPWLVPKTFYHGIHGANTEHKEKERVCFAAYLVIARRKRPGRTV